MDIRKRVILVVYKIFFVGLLLQFLIQTFVTFKLGIQDSRAQYIWLRKEYIILLLLCISIFDILFQKKRQQAFSNTAISWRTLLLIISVVVTFLIHTEILNLQLDTYFLAFKYDFLGFFILLAGFHSSSVLNQKDKIKLLQRYGKLIKYALLRSLIRYFVIFIKPGTLKIFGYDNFVFEGKVGMPPPAAYYHLINHGITRNQFLFERPISRGFFLVAFFPFFFSVFLYQKPLKHTRFWRFIYAINVFLTFSRAARGARILELGLLFLFLSRKLTKKMLGYLILGTTFLVLLGLTGYQKLFQRQYSDTGHIEMLRQSMKIISRNPLRGQGGSSAGPGSHRKGEKTHLRRSGFDPKDGFNPENQYLQVIIEFGLIGFLGRFFLYLTLNYLGIHTRMQYRKCKQGRKSKKNTPEIFLLSVSIGMIGLSMEGLVLHSFTDRMIVYPFMLLFGIIRMMQRTKNQKYKEKIANVL